MTLIELMLNRRLIHLAPVQEGQPMHMRHHNSQNRLLDEQLKSFDLRLVTQEPTYLLPANSLTTGCAVDITSIKRCVCCDN